MKKYLLIKHCPISLIYLQNKRREVQSVSFNIPGRDDWPIKSLIYSVRGHLYFFNKHNFIVNLRAIELSRASYLNANRIGSVDVHL